MCCVKWFASLVGLTLCRPCLPIHFAAEKGLAAVTKQLLAACCNVDLQKYNDRTALQIAERLNGTRRKARAQRSHVLSYCRLAPNRPKRSRKMLIGRWKIITKRIGKVSRKRRRETAARPEENFLSHRKSISITKFHEGIYVGTGAGDTALQAAHFAGHTSIATLIRNTKHEGKQWPR